MKVDRTKYTVHRENGIVVAQWVSIEMSVDEANGENPLAALDRSMELEQQWFKSKNIGMPNGLPPGPPTEMPVINKAEERIGILIENATTKEELMKHKNELTTPYLSDLFGSKLEQLAIQSRNK